MFIRPLVIALLALSLSQASYAKSRGETEKELKQLHEAWALARVKADKPFLENFYGKELTLNVMDGSVVTRASDIDAFASGRLKPVLVEDEELKVSVYGDTAVVTGIEHVRGTNGGVAGEFRLRFTNVLVRRNGRWQLVQHQSTGIRK